MGGSLSIASCFEQTIFVYMNGMDACFLLHFLLGNQLIDDAVQEHSSNANGAPKQLHGVQALSKDNGHADNDDDALGRVGNGLRHGTRLFEGRCGQFIVSVEPYRKKMVQVRSVVRRQFGRRRPETKSTPLL